MRIWGALLLGWLSLFLLTFAQPACATDTLLAEAADALRQGLYETAAILVDHGLARTRASDLGRARLLVIRGLARQGQGANEDALSEFTSALALGALPAQEQARALFARGVSLDSLGRLEDAMTDYSHTLKLAPGAQYALNNLANVYRRQNRFEEARSRYLAALRETNPNPQYPYYGLGQIAEAEANIDAARDFYRKAVAADPGFSLALERLKALSLSSTRAVPAVSGVIVLRPLAGPARRAAGTDPPMPVSRTGRLTASAASATDQAASLRGSIVDGRAAGGTLAQLGAWRSEGEAQAGWKLARDQANDILAALRPIIVRVQIPSRGAYYRLRVRPEGVSPSQFCAALTSRQISCVPAFR